MYLPEIYSIWRSIFSNFTSSGNMLGGRYYPMGVFTPVYPISAHILKTYATEIAPVLTFIFQQSLSSGYVPTDWRLANIPPIFKKGDKSTPSNYRPVSITSICSKLIEHIIFSNVMDHYENNNVLVDVQHGFRPGRSCETQLLITAQDLNKSLDNKEQVDAVVLDFSKAFD